MNIGKLHEKLKPFCWLIGEWKSITAVANYPTVKHPLNHNAKLCFTSVGQPILNYSSVAWGGEDNAPMHLESGYLTIDEDQSSVALMVAHNFGVATVEEGIVKENCMIINTSCIGHMKFVNHKVVSLHRCYKLNDKGQLQYCAMMETSEEPLKEYLYALYEKC